MDKENKLIFYKDEEGKLSVNTHIFVQKYKNNPIIRHSLVFIC